jgi:hypothetical protein
MSNIIRELFSKYRLRILFTIAFVLCYAVFAGWLRESSVSGLVAILDFAAPVALFAAFLLVLFARSTGERLPRVLSIVVRFAFWYAVVHAALFATLGVFAYYQNEISPATLPKVTVSNGDRTVVFRTMSHVAVPEFYRAVIADIEAAKRDGSWYFYEGVRPGSPESQNEFDRLLGVDFDRDFYSELGKFAGLVAQDDFEFTGLVNDRESNLDVDLDTVVRRIHERSGSGVALAGTSTGSQASAAVALDLDRFAAEAGKLTRHELALFEYFNRAMLNFMLKLDSLPESLAAADPRYADLFAVILDERDEHIAHGILESPEKKLFLTYGLMHFNGVYARMKKADPKYAIVKIEPYYPLVSDRSHE